jgi:uncharacterized membrane protein YtjA (UPF0391 family)
MWDWPITYLTLGLITGFIAFFDVGGAGREISWLLCVVFFVLFVGSLLKHRSV